MPLDAPTLELLERYLDGDLASPDLASFEARLLRENDLRDEVAIQRAIDRSLCQRFALPVPAESPSVHLNGFHEGHNHEGHGHERTDIAGRIAPAKNVSRQSRGLRWAGSIAALVLITTGTWLAWQALRSTGPVDQVAMLTADQYYRQETAHFEPFWKCDTNEQFASTFRNRFGQPLLIQPLPEGVTAHGLDYTWLISRQTMSVLMTRNDEMVIVLVDRADRESEPLELPADTSLHLHRQQVGLLVLYEITPSPTPQMLRYFFNPDEQAATGEGEWK